MTYQEGVELSRYFRLITYVDDNSILLDEYNELEDIIKKNKYARVIDDCRTEMLTSKMTEEEYNGICDYYYDMILATRKPKEKTRRN